MGRNLHPYVTCEESATRWKWGTTRHERTARLASRLPLPDRGEPARISPGAAGVRGAVGSGAGRAAGSPGCQGQAGLGRGDQRAAVSLADARPRRETRNLRYDNPALADRHIPGQDRVVARYLSA